MAATYGSVIIVQHEKKISGRVSTDKADLNAKPADVGGIAGGEKFEQEGIIYKFAVDHVLIPSPSADCSIDSFLETNLRRARRLGDESGEARAESVAMHRVG